MSDQLDQTKKILIVDDDPAILSLLGVLLKRAGYLVGAAKDGAEALDTFRKEAWDLVLTDRALPKLSGEQLAREITGISPLMPLLLMTGLPGNVREPELFRAILAKPFSWDGLLRAVADALA